jgi:hypothetical protein
MFGYHKNDLADIGSLWNQTMFGSFGHSTAWRRKSRLLAWLQELTQASQQCTMDVRMAYTHGTNAATTGTYEQEVSTGGDREPRAHASIVSSLVTVD